MADKRKAAKEQANREAARRRLSTLMLAGGRENPLVAVDREFRTPIYSGLDLPQDAYASTRPDLRSPSLSRISIAPELQHATSIADYLMRVKPIMNHERVHVLQNVDQMPFQQAERTLRENARGFEGGHYENLLKDYNSKEAQAYALAGNVDSNEGLRKRFEEDASLTTPYPGILDKFRLLKTKNEALSDIRQQLLNSLPTGLQNIISGWTK